MSKKHYKKINNISYTLGPYPTIELLIHKASCVERIIMSSKFTHGEGYDLIKNNAEKHRIPIEYNDKRIYQLSSKNNCYVVGVFKKYHSTLAQSTNHVVLVNPKDPGNVGTIMRCMLAFDFTDLAIIKPAVDIFLPDTIRASMGSFFSLNFQTFSTIEEYVHCYTARNIYAMMTTGADCLAKTFFKTPFSLIFGNEASGLPRTYEQIGKTVRIPQSKKVDSLNVAISAGIILYDLYVRKSEDLST